MFGAQNNWVEIYQFDQISTFFSQTYKSAVLFVWVFFGRDVLLQIQQIREHLKISADEVFCNGVFVTYSVFAAESLRGQLLKLLLWFRKRSSCSFQLLSNLHSPLQNVNGAFHSFFCVNAITQATRLFFRISLQWVEQPFAPRLRILIPTNDHTTTPHASTNQNDCLHCTTLYYFWPQHIANKCKKVSFQTLSIFQLFQSLTLTPTLPQITNAKCSSIPWLWNYNQNQFSFTPNTRQYCGWYTSFIWNPNVKRLIPAVWKSPKKNTGKPVQNKKIILTHHWPNLPCFQDMEQTRNSCLKILNLPFWTFGSHVNKLKMFCVVFSTPQVLVGTWITTNITDHRTTHLYQNQTRRAYSRNFNWRLKVISLIAHFSCSKEQPGCWRGSNHLNWQLPKVLSPIKLPTILSDQ